MYRNENELSLSARYIHRGNSSAKINVLRDIKDIHRCTLNLSVGTPNSAVSTEVNFRGTDQGGMTSIQLLDIASMLIYAARNLDDNRIPQINQNKLPNLIGDDGSYWNSVVPNEISNSNVAITSDYKVTLRDRIMGLARIIGPAEIVPQVDFGNQTGRNYASEYSPKMHMLIKSKVLNAAAKLFWQRQLEWMASELDERAADHRAEVDESIRELVECAVSIAPDVRKLPKQFHEFVVEHVNDYSPEPKSMTPGQRLHAAESQQPGGYSTSWEKIGSEAQARYERIASSVGIRRI